MTLELDFPRAVNIAIAEEQTIAAELDNPAPARRERARESESERHSESERERDGLNNFASKTPLYLPTISCGTIITPGLQLGCQRIVKAKVASSLNNGASMQA